MTAENTTVAALKMAIKNRKPNAGSIIHSGRGPQYARDALATLVKRNKLARSMSRKGNSSREINR